MGYLRLWLPSNRIFAGADIKDPRCRGVSYLAEPLMGEVTNRCKN